MCTFPHSHLFLGESRTIVISGPHIQVLETKTGELLHSTAKFDGGMQDALLASGHVRCAAVDIFAVHLTTSGDDKVLKVWKIDGLQLLSSRELPKKPTGIRFLRDGQTILVSDKFGDIFSYPIHPISLHSESKSRRDALTSHENLSGGTLILGHTSVVTSFVLSVDERYVISADRDEHVRVSWYPQGWHVEIFCLGHEKYVSSIHIPCFSPGTLISGGGDPMLRIWDWMTGKLRVEVEVWSTVQRFIKIQGGKKGRGWGDDAGGGKERERKGKGIINQNEEVDVGDAEDHGGEMGFSVDNIAPDKLQENFAESSGVVQVLHKIDSFHSGSGTYILFSAVGASAIFISPFFVTAPLAKSDIRYFDFGRPVLDFIIGTGGIIWVLLDARWADAADPMDTVRLVRWDSVMQEFKEADEGSEIALLKSLNSICLLPATPEDLKSLDLYVQLSSMPKFFSDDDDGAGDRISHNKNKKRGQDQPQPAATKRELGRLTNKRALARAMEGTMGRGQQEDEEAGREGDGENKRKNKRSRSAIQEGVPWVNE